MVNSSLGKKKKKDEVTGENSDRQHFSSILHVYTHSCLEWECMFSEVRTGLFNSLAKPR